MPQHYAKTLTLKKRFKMWWWIESNLYCLQTAIYDCGRQQILLVLGVCLTNKRKKYELDHITMCHVLNKDFNVN